MSGKSALLVSSTRKKKFLTYHPRKLATYTMNVIWATFIFKRIIDLHKPNHLVFILNKYTYVLYVFTNLGHYLYVGYPNGIPKTENLVVLRSPTFSPPPKYNNDPNSPHYRSCRVSNLL